jgi:F-type H+-transporting ATPase subunit gamma
MASLKDVRRRIEAVKGTQKVTRAMKLVAAAKLRRAQKRALDGRDFSSGLYDSVTRISRRLGNQAPVLWRRPVELNLIDIVVITSDRGLCGGFNENLLRELEHGIEDHLTHNIDVKIFTVGKKGYQYLHQRGYDVEALETDSGLEVFVRSTVDLLCERYAARTSSGCNLGFNKFVNAARQRITFWNLIPLYHIGDASERRQEYVYEPGRQEALDALGRVSLESALRQALLESSAAELAARMSAMDGATKNADDMIAHLTSVYNKARQEAITSELMDIIGGAEVLM